MVLSLTGVSKALALIWENLHCWLLVEIVHYAAAVAATK